MKWSDNWLANVDCNNDGKLDRGLVNGVSDGISKGWLTNHVTGDYTGSDGAQHDYTIFDKIVWVGAGGTLWSENEFIPRSSATPLANSVRFRSRSARPALVSPSKTST